MSLNIKNERVHRLAREAAQRTGRNQTSAIELALERLLAELRQEQGDPMRAQLIAAIQHGVGDADLSTEDLYDDAGLPR